ncbi:Bromodomain adjacent to zinc finger domain protein 2A [Tupaia chinensis]|uniref:Bromodomain adjacent to zinc finger domain protein 2B n=1 Tax=Tupaia chinensis TaxID=246437 RepID=L8Y743_TUPCH|nr:Bromodomain adjacent to zinc finger domain protein 2A [Tupaia chinensis]
MEANDHFNFTGLPPAPAASGLKPSPSSGEGLYTNGSPMNFPQQGKSLNGDVNVNGLSTVSHTTTSGILNSAPHSSSTSHLHHPNVAYDCLWNYSQYPSANPGSNLKDPPLLSQFSGGQYPLNGILVGSRQPSSPSHNTNLRAGSQEFWANGTQSPMGLNFDSQELYDSFPDQNFEVMPNGPPSFFTSPQTSPMLGSSIQTFAPSQEVGSGIHPDDATEKELTSVVAENGAGLVGSLELEEEQPEPVSGGLYGIDDTELMGAEDKLPLEDSPVISALDCPSLNNATAFSLLADDSQTSASIFASPTSPPVLGESVLQAADFLTTSPANKDVSSFLQTSADLEEITGEGVNSSGSGDILRRRIATPEEVRLPLQHGWRREVRIKKGSHRWQGETWYYSPCGKRMKQFPEVIKYLSRNVVHSVRREHFSFSPRMPVGDFFEERDTPQGLQWVQLSAEEIPSRIQAITGKRGRPRNTEKTKIKEVPKVKRGRGRPPKVKVTELLNKTDNRLLKKLEAQETLNEEDKTKMSKSKKKIRQKVQRGECQATQGQARNKRKQETKSLKQKEAKKKSKVEKEKVKTKQEKLKEKVKREKEKEKMKEKEEMIKAKPVCKADKILATQRRLEERQRQQMILEEMKKPTEDMCLADHQPLPDFSRIPGLTLPCRAFSDCLTIVEFLHSFGKVLGFDPAKDVPSLGVLQEGLLCQGDSLGEVQDLLVRLLKAALRDPGLPSYCQSLKILGEKVSEIPLTRDNVSEILRCFLMAYGAEPALCDSLCTQPFQAQPPQQKAAVLAFLVHELNSSTLIINEIDKTLESMSSYRKNKWIVEGRLRRLKTALAKRTGRPEVEMEGPEEGLGRRRSSRIMEETSGMEEDEEEETTAVAHGRRGRRDGEVDTTVSSIPELERQIEKLSKRQLFFRKKLLHSSQLLRAVSLGQDRYRRRYWVLPYLAGIFVEGTEGSLAQVPCDVAPTPPPAVSEDQPTLASSKPVSRPSVANPCSPVHFSSTPLPGITSKRRIGDSGEMPQSPVGLGQPKRRGRPPSKFLKQMEQRYLIQLTAQPIPPEMRSGWWWIRDPEMLDAMLKALHPRGIREKALHKHLNKHRDFLQEVCLRPSTDPIFEPNQLPAFQEGSMNWSPKEKTYETDLAVLQWVEELERRVVLSDLQIRGWACPSPDSTREDLTYCEHLPDSQEEITWRGRGREGLAPQRKTTNPLDLAVMRLAALEQNVERRYLREPLWPAHEVVLEKALLTTPNGAPQGTPTEISYEITPRIRVWRQTLERCRSAAQVCLCLGQLERSIAWEKSVNKVTCLVCRKGDNDEFLLLCDGCDRGCHIYCHRPKMEAVPEGDWFCAVCLAQVEGEFAQKPGFPKRGQKRKSDYLLNFPEGDGRRRRVLSRGRESPAVPRYSEEGLSPSKRRRLSMRNHQSDLTFCEIILMEMESHDAAWPFLEPVNPRLVSGYRRIIKNPMDFSTMRERLLRGGYTSSEEFAADALLVFDNCQTFNEDDSEVGKAGHIMRRFFESRWEEFYQGKQANL